MFKKLFGKGQPPADEDAFAVIRRDYARLLIQPSGRELELALDSWTWLRPPKGQPLLVSAFGDMFFRGANGILMLDTLEGDLRPVAADGFELRARLAEPEQQDELLSSVWVQAAERQGLVLESGECFDWSVPPALGGRIAVDAITKLSFVVKADLAGQMHEQIKALPPGTKINRVTISD
ncbi:T6SS immunity protein Tdi1 domain-containing protein [Phenylobacterium sp.]|uniref:T6SS immunity protein Tdi1 domain-containing protein n=1 Tax=Phenylobacterium sp. TaxID=1871053 RepID=UPI00271FF569|nr:T6SS immunity protein Tdi1 domain-containing protein [Phenylobacterium sp.]MDO8378172.1 DUF1851 domain-containing protein [Phenylobacterium sp.]